MDEDLVNIEIAKELGVPVTQLRFIPAHLIGSAHVLLAWRRMENESARAKATQQRQAAEMNRMRQGR